MAVKNATLPIQERDMTRAITMIARHILINVLLVGKVLINKICQSWGCLFLSD
jgi:hypothetical protein